MLEAEGISRKNLKISCDAHVFDHAVPQGFLTLTRKRLGENKDRHHDAASAPLLRTKCGPQGHLHPGPAGREDLPPCWKRCFCRRTPS